MSSAKALGVGPRCIICGVNTRLSSTMNSRQRVNTALCHIEPDRVPMDLGGTAVSTIRAEGYPSLEAHLGLAPCTRRAHTRIRTASTWFETARASSERSASPRTRPWFEATSPPRAPSVRHRHQELPGSSTHRDSKSHRAEESTCSTRRASRTAFARGPRRWRLQRRSSQLQLR